MKGLTKDKMSSDIRKPVEQKQKKQFCEICEICGREMERDPESGECFCPDCFYAEDKA